MKFGPNWFIGLADLSVTILNFNELVSDLDIETSSPDS